MYGADWCGDCRRAKAWFTANDVAYTFVDLVEHPDEIDRVLERNNGLKRIPVIVFDDDSHLVEPTDDELAAKMAALAGEADTTGTVTENTAEGRFELRRDGTIVSFATYDDRNGSVVVPHVETMPIHRGNGYAAELMEGLLGILRATDRTIVPLCPFAAGHIRDDERHHDLLTR